MSSPTTYELFAIKYAAIDRPAPENFVFRDVHDGPMPLDFFLWVAKSPERTFVIDTGFSEETGARRNRTVIRNPREGLAALDIDAAQIDDVIITHMHHDHVGNFEIFPRARFHLQDREMAYATGRYMCHPRLRMPFDIENVTGMVREVHRGRVAFHDGDDELASGISLHLVGGHSAGLQFVRVHTQARLGRGRLGCDPFLRQRRDRQSVSDRVQRRRHDGGLGAVPPAGRQRRPRGARPRSAGARALPGAGTGARGHRGAARRDADRVGLLPRRSTTVQAWPRQ